MSWRHFLTPSSSQISSCLKDAESSSSMKIHSSFNHLYPLTTYIHQTVLFMVALTLKVTYSLHNPARFRITYTKSPAMVLWNSTTLQCTTIYKLLDEISNLCARPNLRFHSSTCLIFSQTVRWCGRLNTPDAWSSNPQNIEALHSMSPLTSIFHPQQFSCSINLVRTVIPHFSELIIPLLDFMTHVMPLLLNALAVPWVVFCCMGISIITVI